MRPQLLPAVVASLLLCSSLSFAGTHYPHSYALQKTGFTPMSPKGVKATAVFSCETRAFDPSLNEDGGVACYGPKAMRAAYGTNKLINAGYTGAGQTIVILAAYGSPTVHEDLEVFNDAFGLPHPPSFRVIEMPGTPQFDPESSAHFMWAQEVSLGTQWAHAIAPMANLVLVAAASSSDDDMLAALNYAIKHELGDVISMSFGQSEAFLSDEAGQKTVGKWEKAFAKARQKHITMLASAGDQGSTNIADDWGNVLGFRNVSYPASSPQVTAVGGTNLYFGKDGHADPTGKYISETAWNDQPLGISAAGGGGISSLFKRPAFQNLLPAKMRKTLTGRAIPDVSYSAGMAAGVVVRLGFAGMDGFYILGGTSVGVAQWAGLVADLNQALSRSMGYLNGKLYLVGMADAIDTGKHDTDLLRDITTGNNEFCGFTPEGESVCVPGYSAAKGWDLVTGWGTPNFGTLLKLFDRWCWDDAGL